MFLAMCDKHVEAKKTKTRLTTILKKFVEIVAKTLAFHFAVVFAKIMEISSNTVWS